MGILSILFGNSSQEYEQKGDSFFNSGAYGKAKLEYETGLAKLNKKDPNYGKHERRLQDKILETRESLAHYHKQEGDEILESEYYEEAKSLFYLALELTENPELKEELKERINQIREYEKQDEQGEFQGQPVEASDIGEEYEHLYEDEYFSALCGLFSDREREMAYHSYGDAFKQGYLALNNGDFAFAENKLLQALEENPSPGTYIPLELATVYANLGKNEEAKQWLIPFLDDHPDSFQAYQILCEIFWEMNEHDKALEILKACPSEFIGSPQILYLQGETYFHAHNFQEAKALYRDYLLKNGWDEVIAMSLAKTLETIDEKEEALDLYGEIISQCSSCGRQIPPSIKRRYADISHEFGRHTTDVLEMYLSLIQEDPDNKKQYYEKVRDIYLTQGNEEEARRFQLFADQS